MRCAVQLLALCLALLVAAAAARSLNGGVSVQPGHVADAVEMWKKQGKPAVLKFSGKDGKPVDAHMILKSSSSSLDYTDSAVTFHLYTQNNSSDVEGTVVSFNAEDIQAAGWNSGLPTKVVIHGFDDDITCPIIQDIKNGYLETGEYNVIGVDWSSLCEAPWYIEAVENVHPVGIRVGEFITFLLDSDLTETAFLHTIGHSLGAHVAGIASLYVANNISQISRATGLDPALPLFELASDSEIINKEDAEMVDIIHTTAGYLGFAKALGDVDFYPNGGQSQPGCGLDLFWICSHDRAFELFAESIIDNGGFISAYCTSRSNAEDGNCDSNVTATMGNDLHFMETGLYYLKTAGSIPYNLERRSSTQDA